MLPTVRLIDNFGAVLKAGDAIQKGHRSVVREALNRTTERAATDVRQAMPAAFDRPTPFTLNSLRVYFASNATLTSKLWFRERKSDTDVSWALPQIRGGSRQMKPMEKRLQRAGILPSGWMVVPGDAAPLDAYGNMSRGEISRILNVLGTYMEAGYNKANANTKAKLRKGTKKTYGFAYWVNPAGPGRRPHLPPGIYRRVYTPFGSSLKPMLIFISGAKYSKRFDFAGIVKRSVAKHFPHEYDKAMTSFLKTGSASAMRRGGEWR